jgi:hypothetical protein
MCFQSCTVNAEMYRPVETRKCAHSVLEGGWLLDCGTATECCGEVSLLAFDSMSIGASLEIYGVFMELQHIFFIHTRSCLPHINFSIAPSSSAALRPDLSLGSQSVHGRTTYPILFRDLDSFGARIKILLRLFQSTYMLGNYLSSPVVWCRNSNYSLSFPISRPEWMVNALMSLGV